MINFEIIENIGFTRLGTMKACSVPPINTHLILQNIDYIIDYENKAWEKVYIMEISCYN